MEELRPVIRPRFVRGVRRAVKAWPQGLCAALALSLSFYVLAWTPVAWENWLARDYVRHQARAAVEVDYDQVRRDPAAYVGKSVRWALMYRDGQGWFYKGDPAKPIRWHVPPPDINTYRQYVTVVGSVGGADGRGVELSYQGLHEGVMLVMKLPS